MGHCKDCAFAKRAIHDIIMFAGTYEFAQCGKTRIVNPVTGKSSRSSCSIERQFGACGKEGKLFEPKRTRSIAPVVAGLALAILAGTLVLPSVAHAQAIDRPDSTGASIGLALIVGGIILGLASYAGLRAIKVEDKPEDYDSAGRL